jgi:hypothetical protein
VTLTPIDVCLILIVAFAAAAAVVAVADLCRGPDHPLRILHLFRSAEQHLDAQEKAAQQKAADAEEARRIVAIPKLLTQQPAPPA